MDFRGNIREGMTCYDSDGKKLGKVVKLENDGFVIEKGFFFPKDYWCSYSYVADLKGDDIHLNQAGNLFANEGAERKDTRAEGATAGAAMSRTEEQAKIPLAEEQLEAHKYARQAGEVKVHKDVVTDTAQISVPVRHEEVRVERAAAPAGTAPQPGQASFQEGTTTIPVMEEEVEIRKRPVVREEVRVSKEAYTEERRASDTVRKEVADVEKTGDLDRRTDVRDDPYKNR